MCKKTAYWPFLQFINHVLNLISYSIVFKPHFWESIKTEDNKVKANILSEYFSSVFTKEPEGDVPVPNDIMVQQDMPALTGVLPLSMGTSRKERMGKFIFQFF
jgi:hypothetical protein